MKANRTWQYRNPDGTMPAWSYVKPKTSTRKEATMFATREMKRERVRALAHHLMTTTAGFSLGSWQTCMIGHMHRVPAFAGLHYRGNEQGATLPYTFAALGGHWTQPQFRSFFGLPGGMIVGRAAGGWNYIFRNAHHAGITLLEAIGDCGPKPLWQLSTRDMLEVLNSPRAVERFYA